MRLTLKVAILGICTILMLLIDLPLLRSVDEAEAIAGVRRRTARRTAVVVGGTTAAAASAATASANQQAAASQQQAAAAEAEAAAAQQQAAAAEAEAEAYKQQAAAAQAQATAAGVLPIGTVVTALPAGCTTVTSGGVEYHSCGGNYYRAAFQGSQLVYVTAQP
jgi:glucose/arabinose dehydrogenase